MTVYQKKSIAIRYWLLGRGYHNAVRAMEYASGFHTGVRKDGETPEFAHQVEIAQYVRTLTHGLRYPEETLAAVFLHDVSEDYQVGPELIEREFGAVVAEAVWLLTKEFNGEKKPIDVVFASQSQNPIASVVKGADRIHNFQSMVDVFSLPKQQAYIEECESYILPMLKTARRHFPDQEPVYENVKHVLHSQIDLIRAIHRAKENA